MGFDNGGASSNVNNFCFYNNSNTNSYFLFWDTNTYITLNSFVFIKNSNVRMDSFKGLGNGKIILFNCYFDIPLISSNIGQIILMNNCIFNITYSFYCLNNNEITSINNCPTLINGITKLILSNILIIKLILI